MAESTPARPARVLLGVTGCIAAYKACEVLRGLQKADVEVRVAMTEDGTRFVGSSTFEALSHYPVATDLFNFSESAIPHIDLSEWADLVVVCPCTANVLAKAASGIADDCLTSAMLAAGPAKLVLAPAMNVHMWENPATQANCEQLRARGVRIIEPAEGRLACGDIGSGKLPEVETLVGAVLAELARGGRSRDLSGKRLVITAGPTQEAIDPVRYIANASTGKMGYALAQAAAAHGAQVTLVTGPSELAVPTGVEVVRVRSAAEMYAAATSAFEEADVAICAAAVADYTPSSPATRKLKKDEVHLDTLALTETADILRELCVRKAGRPVVGFAAETHDVVEHARAKLARKGCDLMVANDVTRADSGFGTDTDAVTLVTATETQELPCLPKYEVAEIIIEVVAGMVASGAAR